MPDITPSDFILKCYGYQSKGRYIGVCLDFNLSTQAETPEEVKQKMNEIIASYIETVFDTDDKRSIPELLRRRAPIRDYLAYYYIKILTYLRKFPGNFIFNEIIPFHLSHNCQ